MQGNDDVYMCVKDGDKVSVSAAFVRGRTHPDDPTEVTNENTLGTTTHFVWINHKTVT